MKEQLYLVIRKNNHPYVYMESDYFSFFTSDRIKVARELEQESRVFLFPQLQEIEKAGVYLDVSKE